MKITKNSSKTVETSSTKKAVEHIQCAINLLGPSASTDPVAREALINLGVIAVDLNTTDSPRR